MSESVFGEIEAQDRARIARMNSPLPTEIAMVAISELGLPERHRAGYFLARLWMTLHHWRRRARQRAQLAQMTECELHDLGLSFGSIYAELRKPFWRE